jgi:hypothetical protein
MPDGAKARISAGAIVIDLGRWRLARLIGNAGQRQAELARLMQTAAQERVELADTLMGAQVHLSRISRFYGRLLRQLEREKTFRDACQAATELDDLDEMIRRRDELVRQFQALRQPDTAAGGEAEGCAEG